MTMFIDGPQPGPSSPPFQNNSLKQYQFQFYPGCSPGTLMGPLDIPDLHNQWQPGSMTSPSSISSSLLLHKKLGNIAASNPICKDYTCCGLTLHDLHALVEHFEECHVVVVDDDDQPTPTQPQSQQQPQPTTSQPQQTSVTPASTSKPQPAPITTTTSSTAGTATAQTAEDQDEGEIDIDTLDDMDISDSEEDSPSPPSPVQSSGYSTPSLSPPLTPVMAFDTITTTRHQRFLGPGGGGPGIVGGLGIDVNLAAGAFNSYGGLVAGKQQPQSIPSQPQLSPQSQPQRKLSCLPPSLLTTPTTSRASSPFPGGSSATTTPIATPTSATPTLPFPLHNLPTPAKPFPCPNPSCSKTYKQSNGLKYHLTHGSCSISPSASGRVEKEEKRFACAIPMCDRRYKNLNGLRYHYAHTGHGGPEYMISAAEKEKTKAENATTTATSGQGEIRKIRLVPHHVLQQQQQKVQQRLQEQEDVIMS